MKFDVPVPHCPICLIYQGYEFPLFNATKVRRSKLILTLSLSLLLTTKPLIPVCAGLIKEGCVPTTS